MDYGVAASNGEIVEIRDVPSGRYSMMAIRGRDSLSDVWPLIVDGDIRDYPLMVFPPVEIRIDKSADTGVRISLTRKGAVSDTRAAEHDSDGRFLFTGVGHGAYYVTAEPPAGYYVSDVIAYRLLPEDPRDPCTPPPPPAPMPRRVSSGLYRYLDPHGHLNKDMPFVVPNVIPGDVRCIGITWRLGGTLVGRVVDRTGNAVPGALVVGLPRSIWGAPDSDAAVTPPDRYLTTSTDNEGKFTLSAAVSDTEYKLFAFEDLDPNLVYDPALLNYFPNRDVIDIEDVAENTPVQRRVQQQQVLRSVTTRLCSENSLCVLKAISADETRSHNMGQ
jgi:hypothetical protein